MTKKEETKIETPVPVGEVVSLEEQYEANIKVVARDLVKAAIDLGVGFDKEFKEVLEDVSNKVNDITE